MRQRVTSGDLEKRRAEGFRIELMAVEAVVCRHDVEGGWFRGGREGGGVGGGVGGGRDGGVGAGGEDFCAGFEPGQFQNDLFCIDLIVAGIAVLLISYLYLVGYGGV